MPAFRVFFIAVLFFIAACSTSPTGVAPSELTENENGLTILNSFGKVYSGTAIDYHPNKHKKSVVKYVKGLKEGIQSNWYQNGQQKMQLTYKNGKEHGEWLSWYMNGNSEFKGNYQEGKEHGERITYNVTDGKKIAVENFEEGIKNGKQINWLPDGTRMESDFINGVQEGWSNLYNNATKIAAIFYKNGKAEGEFKTWYNDGNIRITGQHRHNDKHGEFTYFTKDGSIEKVEYYENGQLVKK